MCRRPSRRILIFSLVFVLVVMLATAAIGLPLHAQGDPPPGETTPPPPRTIHLPLVLVVEGPPAQPPRSYAAIPVELPPTDRPAAVHPDLNLALRGFVATGGPLALVNYGGDTDSEAPQIDGLFNPPRLPPFRALYQVYDWEWGCNPPDGCRGELLTDYPVTLLAVETTPFEPISIPRRAADIYVGDFKALVLYAEERRLTITYTRGDTAANGYLVHLEDLDVNPGLVARYRQLDAAGRGELPALRNGEIVDVADRGAVMVAMRDSGRFLDPRSCKDWWNGYLAQCTVQLQRVHPPAR